MEPGTSSDASNASNTLARTPGTSAAVPDADPLLDVRGLAELDDGAAHDLAVVMTKWWTRINRWSTIGVLAPIGGCISLNAVFGFQEGVLAVATLMLCLDIPLAIIVSAIARREMKDEAELLGYDAHTARAVVATWVKARSSWLPKLTKAAREKACAEALLEARARGRT